LSRVFFNCVQAGKVSAISADVFRIEQGAAHVSSLQPISPAVPLQIAHAVLAHANITDSHIHNAASVTTAALTVRDTAEFLSDVVIDGSVTVHGPVVGSGPYVDSSDARFKKDVANITDALDTVTKLRGVSV
jgi:hypothetical protein